MSPVSGTKRNSLLGASVVSALGTGLSRVLGAARDIAIGHVFGAGRVSDAFWMAWTVPSLFRRFVADEGLTGALIPGVACVVGILGAPWLVRLIAPGFADEPEKLELTIALTRWLFPFVVFVSLVSYCEGLLNYRGHFFIPKLAPGIVSGSMAASALLLAHRLEEPIFALVVGVLVGALTHLLVCIPPLVKYWGFPVPSLRGMRGARWPRSSRKAR